MFFRANYDNAEVCFDHAGVYGLHTSPSRGAPGATQKRPKKEVLYKNLFFLTFSPIWWILVPNWSPVS